MMGPFFSTNTGLQRAGLANHGIFAILGGQPCYPLLRSA
jgi:hypothetical protein